MLILLPLFLCVSVIARVVPAVSNPVPALLLIQNAKVQGGNQQPTKPLLTTSKGSSKIYMSKSKDAIQYSYIIEAVTGTTMAKLNVTIAQIDKQQKAAFSKETNAKLKAYFKSKTKSGYGGMLSVGRGMVLPYFAGYYLDSVVQELAKNPQIQAIVQNVGGSTPMNLETDEDVPWHLYKVSADPNYINYDILFPHAELDYKYISTAGLGVPIYIVDHIWGMGRDNRYSYPPRVISQRAPESNGQLHGEMVAAFAARKDVGVAKKAQIVMIDSGDTVEDALAAIETAIYDYMTQITHYNMGAVINLSIQFKTVFEYPTIRKTIAACLRRFPRIIFVVAAGNDGVDACTWDLNLAPEAIRVSALNKQLEFAPGFNYGRCVDVLAPGDNLEYEDRYISGTSFSAPIVSGLVAYFYSLSPLMNSQYMARNGDMKQAMRRYALTARLSTGEPNRNTPLLLVHNGLDYGST